MSLYRVLSRPVSIIDGTSRTSKIGSGETTDEHHDLVALAMAGDRTTLTKVSGETSNETQSLGWSAIPLQR
jgi:hypothetical protein